jgi:hypothetical protein
MIRSLLSAALLSSLAVGAQAVPAKAKQSPQAAGYLAFLIGTRAGAPFLSYNLGPSTLGAGFVAFQAAASKPVFAAPLLKPVAPAKPVGFLSTTGSGSTGASLTAVIMNYAPTQQLSAPTAPALTGPTTAIQTTPSTAPTQLTGGRPPHTVVYITPPPPNDQPVYSAP